MVDGTRLKVLDEAIKSIQESQSMIHKELDSLTTSFASPQQMLQEILNRLPHRVLLLNLVTILILLHVRLLWTLINQLRFNLTIF